MDTTTDRSALEQKLIPELQRIAQEMGIEGTQRLRKAGLIDAIVSERRQRLERRRDGPVAGRRRGGRTRRRGRTGRRRRRDRRCREDARGSERAEAGNAADEPSARVTRAAAARNAPTAIAAAPTIGSGSATTATATRATATGTRASANQNQGRATGTRAPATGTRAATRTATAVSGPPARSAAACARSAGVREEQERAEEIANAPTHHGHPRPAARRLRLPAHVGLHCRVRGHLRLGVAGAQGVAPQGRRRDRQGPAAARQREVRRAARGRDRQRHRPRGGEGAAELRQAHAAVPRRAVPARVRRRRPWPSGSSTWSRRSARASAAWSCRRRRRARRRSSSRSRTASSRRTPRCT